jgi:hypothetical protein
MTTERRVRPRISIVASGKRAPGKYSTLPEPVQMEDTVENVDVGVHPPEKDEYWREVEWMLRTSGLA